MSASSDPSAKAVNSPPPSSSSAGDDAADPPAATIVVGPLDILSGGRCVAHSLDVTDHHATLLLTHPPAVVVGANDGRRTDESCILGKRKVDDLLDRTTPTTTTSTTTTTAATTTMISSILKLTLVPFHRALLGSNPVASAEGIERGVRPERNSLDCDPRASEDIVSFLRGYDYELRSESGAEYGYYTARPRRIGQDAGASSSSSSSSSCPRDDGVGAFDVELISPADPRQISLPSMGHVLVRETPELYRKVVEPYVRSIVDNGSLSWIRNVVEGRKERERLLVDDDDFIINVDTKWRSHPPPLTTPREEWRGHPSTADLYCLGITKRDGLSCIRDLRRAHVPMLSAMERAGLDAIRETYGVDEDQIRVYVHYHPQFYHFHVHFTRLENESGCSVERGHLVSDVVQNLEMDDEYYAKRTITYKLPRGAPLLCLIGGSS